MATYRYWTGSERPLPAWPEPGAFDLREAPVPKPDPGQTGCAKVSGSPGSGPNQGLPGGGKADFALRRESGPPQRPARGEAAQENHPLVEWTNQSSTSP